MVYTTTADIHQGPEPEDFQSIPFEYEFMITSSKAVITYCSAKLKLLVNATDLIEDVRVAIAEDLDCMPWHVEIVTEIDFPI